MITPSNYRITARLLSCSKLIFVYLSLWLYSQNAIFAGVPTDEISISDVSVTEGNSGTSSLIFTVSRTTNGSDFTVNFATANGATNSATNPSDYVPAAGPLTFTAGGDLSQQVIVTVNGDGIGELDETIVVSLSNLAVSSGSATIADAQGVGTITDDDAVAPTITVNPANATVVAGSTSTLTVTTAPGANPAPTYQWYRGASGVETNPVGSNSSSFTTPALTVTTDYWVKASNLKGTVNSTTATLTVPTESNALLSSLALSQGTLSPVFAGGTLTYSASEANSVTTVNLTPAVAIAGATMAASNNGGPSMPVNSGDPIIVSLSPGINTVAISVTATNTTTTKTYNVSIFRVPTLYTSAIRDVVEPNTGNWPTAGVALGNTDFINLGLQGVGRVPAAMKDPATGESVGSVSDMQITRFVRNANGSYTGTMEMLPDRGYNAGAIFSNYAARINTFTFSFTPYTAAAPTTAQNQITLTFAGSTRFTYDHDANAGTAPVFTTGLLADGPSTMLFGTQVPVVLANTTQSDGTVANRLTVDAEGLAFDKRPGKAGSGWVSDEYGAYIYHFNSAKQIDGQLQLPAALVPHNPVGTNNFLAEGVNGRRINQGMEGLAVSPDGTRLFALLQSATIQDSGTGNPGRSNARLLVYDISTSDTPNDPIAQYVVQLPRADDTGSPTNGVTVNRNCAQSAIVALNGHQILILAREGNGRGVPGSPPPAFKSVLLAELNGATNIDGTYDAEGAQVASAGTLAAGVTPVSWTEALNMLGKLDPARADVEKFGLNLLGGHGDINTLSEKWEGLAVVSANDPANRNDYFLFLGNDNDFLSTTGAYMDASGTLQAYDGGVENDTVILAYRVRLTGPDNQAPFLASAIPSQNAGVGLAYSFAFAATSFADPENQTLTYTATRGDDTPLPAWLTFTPATRQFSGTPTLADSGTYTIKVTATDSGTPALSATATFTITVGQPVTIAATSVTEGNSGTATITFTVTRTVADTEFTVNYAASGTASSGSDYAAIPVGSLTFTAGGALTQTIIATVNGDTTIEANETIILTLSGLVNVTGFSVLPGTGAATGTITNDDFVPSRFPATGVVTSTVKGFIDLDAAPLTGGAEIPAFDPASKRAFTSSGSGVQVIDLTNPAAPAFISTITPATLAVAGPTSNDVSSVAVRKASGANPAVLAASVIASPKTDPGHVVFLNAADGTLLGSVQVGANPDHIAFTPDGTKLLVAIEAETAGNVNLDTTMGGVAIIDLGAGFGAPSVTMADFTAFDVQAAALTVAGVRLFQGGMPSTDLEPEYFAVSADGTKAMVTLQEANAVAVLDIATATFTDIKPLGKKNFALGAHDFSDRDGAGAVNLALPKTGQPVYGLYMPDAIASYSAGGQTYYVTANEGDDRNDFLTTAETTTVGATNYDLDDTVFPNEAALKNQASLGRLTVSNAPGLRGDTDNDGDVDEILSYGGRSFSILDAAGNMVFDSGDMLENIVASQFLSNFDDSRSDNKGPEPEGVTIVTISSRVYAFMSLERSHMVLVFDVTSPTDVKFVSGLRRSGDTNPEGTVYVPPADSPTGQALLLVANENSQTLTIHELTVNVQLNAAAQAGLTLDANCSPLNLQSAAQASPPGGVFSGPGVEGGTFDPALAALGVNVITYTAGTTSVNFNITVTAAPSLPVTQTNALALTMKSTVVLTDTGTTAGVGGAEIPAFDAVSKRAFSASNAGVQVVDLTNPSAPVKLAPIDPTASGLTSKDVSHVTVKNGVLAVSLIAMPDKTMPGAVAFFNAATGALLGSVAVGAVPDQLAWTPDGMKVLVANEGELAVVPAPPALPPFDSDPEGSVSIIDVSGGFAAPTVQTATFHAWNGQEAMMRASGIRVFPGNAASDDLEPEYVAISPDGTKAMVTLQEANAVATLDIASATFTSVSPLGLKNYARVTGDFSDRDGAANANAIELKPNLPAFGMFMPDGIASYSAGGQTYYITANEGDDRNDFITETSTLNAVAGTPAVAVVDLDDTIFPTEGTPGGSGAAGAPGTGLKGNDQLGRLTVSNVPGLRGDLDGDGDVDRILSYGGRSFSILDANGKRVFDSGDLIDRIFAANYPAFWDDSRSDNKSAEPEGVTVSVIGGRAYAFVGLERFHSVLVFDVTDPANVTFVTVASRSGDLNPEGMLVVPAADSPTGNPLLLVANENSFTLTTYEITPATPPMQLQVLHYYGESGLLGIQTAPIMGAMIDKFDNEYPTMVLAEGDTFIPGPWLIAGADPSLNAVPGIGVTALGRPDIAIMNAFGTAASALGNHEFDLGSPVFQAAITTQTSGASTFPGAQFPFITANLDFASDSSLRGQADSTVGGTSAVAFRGDEVTNIRARLAPYAVKTVAGQKIGIVGSTTWDLLTKSSPNGTRPKDDANAATSDLQEVATYVQAAVDALRATGVNKIIMVDQLDALQRNKDLASLVSGIDIMVAGGGHERMGDSTDIAVGFNGHDADFISDAYPIMTSGADGKPVLIVTTDTEYSYLGRLVVDFDANGELITSALNPVVNGAYASSPALLESIYNNGQTAAQIVAASTIGTKVKAIVDALNAVVVAKDGNIYGFTKVYLEGDRVFGRAQEVNLGNLTADANALKARDALGLPATAAVVSLKNGGGLRSSIGSVAADGSKVSPLANPLTGKPQGGISQLDTENALRFDNKLIVFDTTPAGLMAILEYAAGLAAGNGGYPQVGNIRFSYDKTLAPKVRSVSLINDAGSIVAKVAENGVILPSAPALIQAVSLNFTANGGDGYPIKYLDPGAVPPNQIPNPNTDNFRFILNNGTLSAPIARNLDFTAAANVPGNALGEQRAFADYVGARHPTPATGYDVADTPIPLDKRIQQLPARPVDTVLMNAIEEWRQQFFGNTNGAGNEADTADFDNDGVSNLFEFAFGTDPKVSSPAPLSYTGNFAAVGTVTNGQPVFGIQPIPNGADFRFLFIRRSDYLATGLAYIPEFSVKMVSWTPSTAIPSVLADDGTHQLVSVPFTRSIGGRKAQFARVRVTNFP